MKIHNIIAEYIYHIYVLTKYNKYSKKEHIIQCMSILPVED